MGVFDKPKAARKWLDTGLGVSTKKKWTKESATVRSIEVGGNKFFISEWKVKTNADD